MTILWLLYFVLYICGLYTCRDSWVEYLWEFFCSLFVDVSKCVGVYAPSFYYFLAYFCLIWKGLINCSSNFLKNWTSKSQTHPFSVLAFASTLHLGNCPWKTYQSYIVLRVLWDIGWICNYSISGVHNGVWYNHFTSFHNFQKPPTSGTNPPPFLSLHYHLFPFSPTGSIITTASETANVKPLKNTHTPCSRESPQSCDLFSSELRACQVRIRLQCIC